MTHFIHGVHKLIKNKQLIFIFYILNLLSAMIVAIPLRSMLDTFAGHSLAGQALATEFDLSLLVEMISKNATAAPVALSLLLFTGVVYSLLHLFCSGGAYGLFVRDEHYSAPEFWGLSGHFFGRYIRLFFWSIPVFLIFYSLQYVESAFVWIVFGKDPYQYITIWGAGVRLGLGYLGILLYILVFDYARMYILQTDERKTRKALWQGVKFVYRHFPTAFGLSLTIFLAGVLLLVLYNLFTNSFAASGWTAVLFLFVIQQIYIIARVKLQLLLYAAQSSFFNQTFPEQPTERSVPGDIVDVNPLLTI
jgi:hypothetical protein